MEVLAGCENANVAKSVLWDDRSQPVGLLPVGHRGAGGPAATWHWGDVPRMHPVLLVGTAGSVGCILTLLSLYREDWEGIGGVLPLLQGTVWGSTLQQRPL